MAYNEYDGERNIYAAIYKKLADDETIEFDILGNSTAFILKQGCKAMDLPPMTMIEYKPRLIFSSQDRVKMFIDEREDVKLLLLIYGDLKKCEVTGAIVEPIRVWDKMKTISYNEFEETYND